jgi:hypothetical protein
MFKSTLLSSLKRRHYHNEGMCSSDRDCNINSINYLGECDRPNHSQMYGQTQEQQFNCKWCHLKLAYKENFPHKNDNYCSAFHPCMCRADLCLQGCTLCKWTSCPTLLRPLQNPWKKFWRNVPNLIPHRQTGICSIVTDE